MKTKINMVEVLHYKVYQDVTGAGEWHRNKADMLAPPQHHTLGQLYSPTARFKTQSRLEKGAFKAVTMLH